MQRLVAVAEAVDALPALGSEERDHVVAGRDERDAVTDALDDAGSLVPEHARRVAGRVGAGGGVEVGVADAAGGEPDEHLAGLRLGEVDLLDDERAAELLENCCADFHGASLACSGARGEASASPRPAALPTAGCARCPCPSSSAPRASPAICVTTNGPVPVLTNAGHRIGGGIDDRDPVATDLRHPRASPATTSGSPSGPASGTVATVAFVAGSIRTTPLLVVTQTASPMRRSRPPRRDRDRRRDRVRRRIDADQPDAPPARPRPSRRHRRRPTALREGKALDDAVAGRVDALHVAAAVRRRPRCAVREGRVIGREADLDRGDPLAGPRGHAADRVRAACPRSRASPAPEAEAARAVADRRTAYDPVATWVDLEQIGRPVAADPDEPAARGAARTAAAPRSPVSARRPSARSRAAPAAATTTSAGSTRRALRIARKILRYRIIFLRNRIIFRLTLPRRLRPAPRAPHAPRRDRREPRRARCRCGEARASRGASRCHRLR